MSHEEILALPALQLTQGNRKLYSFAVDGKLLPKFTSVSRIRVENGHEIAGYQRPEILAHIGEIRDYIESADPMLPTSIIVAFTPDVTFEPYTTQTNAASVSGIIKIPFKSYQSNNKATGWIVDGQQRVAAIAKANLDNFPVFVTGFIAESEDDQRAQFILVNSPKPLPRDLIYELLPGTEAKMPALLQRRRFSSTLLQRLNHDENSPLFGMIRTPTNPKGIIKDNSILRMLENSLSDGALFQFRTPGTPRGDIEKMLRVLKPFWQATTDVFSDSWGLPPRHSRLMHGAGIVSVGLIMDAISETFENGEIPSYLDFYNGLQKISPFCHWTSGYWEFADQPPKKWNELQNISKDISTLAMYLLNQYYQRNNLLLP